MHLHRLMVLTGLIIGIIGLFFRALMTNGEAALAALNQSGAPFPDSIPTIWGGLDTWAQVVLVVLLAAVAVLAVRGNRADSYERNDALITSVVGGSLLTYAIIKYLDAIDSADDLQAGFAQAAAAGFPGVQAWTVTVSIGFFVLALGTAVVTIAGVLGLSSNDS